MLDYESISKLRKSKGLTWSYLESCIGAYRGKFVDLKKGKTTLTNTEIAILSKELGIESIKQENVKVYDEHNNIVVLDDETREIIDGLRKRPDMKMLFSVSKNATKEDIIQAVKIIEALKDNK